MDAENIDALSPAELDALLERAIDPQVPVEVFYAVLERIGPDTEPGRVPGSPARPGAAEAGRLGQGPDGASRVKQGAVSKAGAARANAFVRPARPGVDPTGPQVSAAMLAGKAPRRGQQQHPQGPGQGFGPGQALSSSQALSTSPALSSSQAPSSPQPQPQQPAPAQQQPRPQAEQPTQLLPQVPAEPLTQLLPQVPAQPPLSGPALSAPIAAALETPQPQSRSVDPNASHSAD